ncbi:MAG: B12-binding domain-containing radical SAM protein, partial [Tissierellia bacterium]|nr:B12-binding domain-containing radical SAM protein [Tissierellia bacterium]
MKKILLIQPSPYDKDHKPIKKSRLYFVGLAMPLLAAMMPHNWEAEIILEIIEDIPMDTDADLIGISTMGHGVIRSIDIAKEFRKRGKTVVLGG